MRKAKLKKDFTSSEKLPILETGKCVNFGPGRDLHLDLVASREKITKSRTFGEALTAMRKTNSCSVSYL